MLLLDILACHSAYSGCNISCTHATAHIFVMNSAEREISASPPEAAALPGPAEAIPLLPGRAGSGRNPAGLNELLATFFSAEGGFP